MLADTPEVWVYYTRLVWFTPRPCRSGKPWNVHQTDNWLEPRAGRFRRERL